MNPDPASDKEVAPWMESLGFVHSIHAPRWLLPGSAPQVLVDDDAAAFLYESVGIQRREAVAVARINENQECQKIVRSLFSTADQLGAMNGRILRLGSNQKGTL